MVHNKWLSEALVCTWISSRNLVAHIDAMTNRIDNNSHVILWLKNLGKYAKSCWHQKRIIVYATCNMGLMYV